jgi:hypothetical protein
MEKHLAVLIPLVLLNPRTDRDGGEQRVTVSGGVTNSAGP